MSSPYSPDIGVIPNVWSRKRADRVEQARLWGGAGWIEQIKARWLGRGVVRTARVRRG